MKIFKKNRSGMTLVEVVIAMAYFSVTTLSVCMAFSAALKYSARNMRRDGELNVQQTAMEKKSTAGVVLNDDATLDAMTIKYVRSGTTDVVASVNNVTEYKAIKTNTDGDDFNFQIKSFSSTPLGSQKLVPDKTQGKFKIYVINNTGNTVDVDITINSGTIFEGSFDNGYRHSSPHYFRTLAAKDAEALGAPATEELMPDRFIIGYYNPTLGSEASSALSVTLKANGATFTQDLNNGFLNTNGQLTITCTAAGTYNLTYGSPT